MVFHSGFMFIESGFSFIAEKSLSQMAILRDLFKTDARHSKNSISVAGSCHKSTPLYYKLL